MIVAHSRLWLFASIVLLPLAAQAESNWPRWRGPLENGHSTEKNLPTEWSTGTLTYKTELPGIGQSSPVIWGERVFLTTAIDSGKSRVVFCVDRNTGKVLWQQTAWTGEPEKSHVMNGWASATCVTDGEMVYAFFGLGGLHAYTVEGKHVWSRDLGKFTSPWGVSACPVLVGDLLIQNCDSEEDANICGIHKKTGEVMWKTQRPNNRGWSTPIVVNAGGRQEAVVNGHSGVYAYDPKSGQQLWFCKSFNGRGEPTVTPAGELLCVINGLSGDAYAIKPGGNGDVTASHMAWHTPRKTGRDCPSPIVIGDTMLVMDMKGVLTCYQPSTGKELWKERIGGNFSASPIAAAGNAYFIDEAGTTYVVRPGEKMNIVATNMIEVPAAELFRASPTPSEGQLFLRSTTHLYVVGKRSK